MSCDKIRSGIMLDTKGGNRALRAGGFLLSAAALAWFFLSFGPDRPALVVLILVEGALVALGAAVRPVWGLAAFIFLLLTANGQPYLFSVQHSEYLPPVSAILFGFLAWGWMLRRLFIGRETREGDAAGRFRLPDAIGKPVGLAAILVAVSAGIAVWRWMNFFPIWGKSVFDWMTNSAGLYAVWARRSVVVSAAGYLLPFAFLAIATRVARDRRGIETTLRAATAGLLLAVVFGWVQHFVNPGLGNTDFWVVLRQINGTFKDPNAFGGVLAILLPLLAGTALGAFVKAKGFREAGVWPAAAAATVVLGAFAFSWIGARSAFLAFAAGLAVVLIAGFRLWTKEGKKSGKKVRRWAVAAAVFLVIAGGAIFVRSRLMDRLVSYVHSIVDTGDLLQLSPERYFLWKHALAMTGDYPLSGVGIGAYIVVLPDYYARDKEPVPVGLEGAQRLDSSENFFLQASSEMGLFGLALMIAIIVGLAREIRRAVRAGILRGPNRWIYLGGVGGLTGFVVNALFHSFTQSFETLFCFWFAASVIVVLGRSGESRPDEKKKSSWMAWAAALAVIVFGAAHLWNSTRSLSISGKSAEFGISQEFGLYRPEQNEEGRGFRWTKADAAWTAEISGEILRLPVRISHPDIADRPVRVAVSIGKPLLRKEISLGQEEWTRPGRKVLEFKIPSGYSGPGMIRLRVDRTWAPREFSDSRDPRRLGAAVESAEFIKK